MKFIRYTILSFMMLCFGIAEAQVLSQVSEKVIEKEMSVRANETLEIHSKKAEVVIKTGSDEKISVKITFTASHPDKEVASKELSYQKYAIEKQGKTLVISNGYFIPQGVSKIFSRMSAKIELTVPARITIVALGEYSDFSISDTNGSNRIRMRFGKLILQNVGGAIDVDTNYGDIDATEITGSLKVQAIRSDIVLRVADLAIQKSIKVNDKEQVLDTGALNIKNTSGIIRIEKTEP